MLVFFLTAWLMIWVIMVGFIGFRIDHESYPIPRTMARPIGDHCSRCIRVESMAVASPRCGDRKRVRFMIALRSRSSVHSPSENRAL